MSFIYNLIIEQTEKEDIFHITWHNTETNTQDSFTQPVEMTSEEIRGFRHQPKHHPDIGQKLFYFLDGDSRYFLRVLDQAKQQGQSIQVNLHPCQKVADWPFELLAINNTFLLPHQLHLVRCVSDWGRAKSMTPQNRPLKLLFAACSPMDVKPELDFEREEEAIFHITEKLEIDIEVEYSGSLQGLHNQLQQEQYDVVHLSGYVNIDQNGHPYFIMEDEIGGKHRVFPENLWEEALIENPPHLLFLSGIRLDDALYSPESSAFLSLGQRLAKSHPLSTVLEWDRPAKDEQVIHAGKIFYQQLSRGKSILEAIQRMRYELLKNFSETTNPAWPMLRLFSTGMELNALVKENQQWQPKSRRMKHIYLKYSQARVLIEGFVGRRRQLQNSLRTLKNNIDKLGVLILGDAGVGKSSLAGKICEQFTNHTIIIVHGKLNTITLESALKDAFIISQDEEGQKILSQKREITKKLPDLMATSFIKKNYLLLLDDFDKNLEGADKSQPGLLTFEAAELLKILLQYLHISGKMTQLIITNRCEFSLIHEDRDLVKERLEKIWLTNFNESEQQKKARQLEHIINYPDQSVVQRLLTAGHGNPRLMEWLDDLVGEMEKAEVTDLLEAVKKKQQEFFEEFSSVKEIPRADELNASPILRPVLPVPKSKSPQSIPGAGIKAKRKKIFISYSHEDKKWLERVQKNLSTLKHEGFDIDMWADTQIKPGMKWEEEISKALGETKIAILLISSDFLASDSIRNNILPPLLKAAENEGVIILPLIITPSRFEKDKNLSQFQPVNNPGREPLISLNKGEQERILLKLVNRIEEILSIDNSGDE